jgi:hypothetical protein
MEFEIMSGIITSISMSYDGLSQNIRCLIGCVKGLKSWPLKPWTTIPVENNHEISIGMVHNRFKFGIAPQRGFKNNEVVLILNAYLFDGQVVARKLS